MKISQHVDAALIDWDHGRLDSAIMHASAAVDGTARRMYPTLRNAERFKKCLRHFNWIVEPALGVGLDLEKTRFTNVKLQKISEPDFADIAYEVFRCSHAHGDEVPPEFQLLFGNEDGRTWTVGQGELRLPHTILFALLFVAVFAPVNKDEAPIPRAYLTLGAPPHQVRFDLLDSWGKSAIG